MFKHEADVWFRLNHPHVVQLFGACDVGSPAMFVCEYATNGSLDKYLKAHPDQLWRKLHEAALGVQYLHQRSIVHGDLKCNNMVVGSDVKAKVTDFGLSLGGGVAQISGAMPWIAPECMGKDRVPPTFESDIYSLGMCVIEAMMVAENKCFPPIPWGGIPSASIEYHVKTKRELPRRPDICTDEQSELVRKMCAFEPSQRIKIDAVLYTLECFAAEESSSEQEVELKSERMLDVDAYEGGELVSIWAAILDQMGRYAANSIQQQVFHQLEAIHAHLQGSSHSWRLLKRFHRLLEDFLQASDDDFVQYRVLDLATPHSTLIGSSLSQRIQEMWGILDLEHDGMSVGGGLRAQIVLFVTENPSMWMLSKEIESKTQRHEFAAFLKMKVETHRDSYSPGQLAVMKDTADMIASRTVLATTPRWFIPSYELKIDRWSLIAAGAFGRVYRATWLGSKVVVKELTFSLLKPPSVDSDDFSDSDEDKALPNPDRGDPGELGLFMHEVEAWFRLIHPHVVRLYGACHVGTPAFVCEYASNGSLDKYLRKHPEQIWAKFHETALGVQYLHQRGIIHGDLKCNNIVVASDGAAKVTDFGMSAPSDSYEASSLFSAAWQWMAPECLKGEGRGFASDIYSLGMCVVEALRVVYGTSRNLTAREYSHLPWGKLEDHAVKVHVTVYKRLLGRPTVCTDAHWALVEKMCQQSPDGRIAIDTVAEELKRFADAGWSDISQAIAAAPGDRSDATKIASSKPSPKACGCPKCGSPMPRSYRFCGNCGFSLQPSSSAGSDPIAA